MSDPRAISEGTKSVQNVLRIVRMRGQERVATGAEALPFRRAPGPTWARVRRHITEQHHEQRGARFPG